MKTLLEWRRWTMESHIVGDFIIICGFLTIALWLFHTPLSDHWTPDHDGQCIVDIVPLDECWEMRVVQGWLSLDMADSLWGIDTLVWRGRDGSFYRQTFDTTYVPTLFDTIYGDCDSMLGILWRER